MAKQFSPNVSFQFFGNSIFWLLLQQIGDICCQYGRDLGHRCPSTNFDLFCDHILPVIAAKNVFLETEKPCVATYSSHACSAASSLSPRWGAPRRRRHVSSDSTCRVALLLATPRTPMPRPC